MYFLKSYSSKSILLLECDEESLPVFAEINDICILKNEVLFIVILLETISYDDRVNGYLYKKLPNYSLKLINAKNLIFPHPLSSFKLNNQQFIPLINHQRCEFVG